MRELVHVSVAILVGVALKEGAFDRLAEPLSSPTFNGDAVGVGMSAEARHGCATPDAPAACPHVLAPQQTTSPVASSAQACESACATLTTPEETALGTGSNEFANMIPFEYAPPQHKTEPAQDKAQVVHAPAETEIMPELALLGTRAWP